MKLKVILFIAITVMIIGACGNKTDYHKQNKNGQTNDELKLTGDKTVYGLACRGCTDSVIVMLPNDGSDPVKYNIIDASHNRKIIGRPKIGDWLGLVINPKNNKIADMVIDLDQLKGTWCYEVMPEMKALANMNKRLRTRIMAHLSDSIKATFMIPREYGFTLSRHWSASSVGHVLNQGVISDDSPVVYPKLKSYTEWHILNGKLVLTHGQIVVNKSNNDITYTNLKNDTAEFVFMTGDSLCLKFDNRIVGYYRKTNAAAANQQAKAAAAKQSKHAIQ